MIIHALKCNNCGNIIFSRSRHDMRGCLCGNVYIDGGFDYMKVSMMPEALKRGYQILTIQIRPTKETLWRDYNFRHDKWGQHKKGDPRIKILSVVDNVKSKGRKGS